MDADRKTQTRAKKALEKIDKIKREWRSWLGREPEVIRLAPGDYLALVECNYVRDGKLSGTDLEVKIG